MFKILISVVGIFSKINKYFSKFTDAVKDNVLPVLGKIGDAVDSDFVKGVASFAAPALNSFIPGLGSGLNMASPLISKMGKTAKNISKGCNNDPNYLMTQTSNFLNGRPNIVSDTIQ
jgi:hypothetical protein